MKQVRLLKAEEIECRVASINEWGITLLLYKDARVDMSLLDETYGPMNWQRTHQMIGDRMFCTISVWDEDKKQWISKQDIGSAGFTEIEKSQASDSFKRSGFCWSIGRELYTCPVIKISPEYANIQKKGDRFFTYDKFSVSEIGYSNERVITDLVIVNDKGREVFRYSAKKKKDALTNSDKTEKKNVITEEQIKVLDSEMKRTGVSMKDIADRYKVSEDKRELSPDIYKRVISALKKTKNAA